MLSAVTDQTNDISVGETECSSIAIFFFFKIESSESCVFWHGGLKMMILIFFFYVRPFFFPRTFSRILIRTRNSLFLMSKTYVKLKIKNFRTLRIMLYFGSPALVAVVCCLEILQMIPAAHRVGPD